MSGAMIAYRTLTHVFLPAWLACVCIQFLVSAGSRTFKKDDERTDQIENTFILNGLCTPFFVKTGSFPLSQDLISLPDCRTAT